jgi:hypothetical protein
VIVTAGVTSTGINAALTAGGAISGTVTDAAGTHHGLENVSVNVWSQTGAQGYATTSADGSYTVTGLPTGTDYAVCFTGPDATGGSSAPGYLDQCYNHQPTWDTANPVAVTAGSTTTGINAALLSAGAISGTVTDAGGTHHGLADVGVDVTSGEFYGNTITDADGSYTIKGLPAGTDYQVCFTDYGATGGSSESGYLSQCYLNQPDSSSATPVVVTLGTTRTGINAALAHNP